MATNPNDIHQESLRWHERLAMRITTFIGSMLCAFLFAIIATFNLPAAIAGGVVTFIPWFAQTFLQLVLLSIIMVGQNLQQRHSELVADETYRVAMRAEQETEEIHKKLDELLKK